ncbi:hypothetical protein [Olsenella sp. Marseille-P4559]|uniref:hypothetical protein n=1 Tax=Olsenella sp. Marseille-P4559 TaxID=2364795 RepID=UPI0010321AF0|nr:hypothetical protein [Olsenella sp. Marseille-P4559]
MAFGNGWGDSGDLQKMAGALEQASMPAVENTSGVMAAPDGVRGHSLQSCGWSGLAGQLTTSAPTDGPKAMEFVDRPEAGPCLPS